MKPTKVVEERWAQVGGSRDYISATRLHVAHFDLVAVRRAPLLAGHPFTTVQAINMWLDSRRSSDNTTVVNVVVTPDEVLVFYTEDAEEIE